MKGVLVLVTPFEDPNLNAVEQLSTLLDVTKEELPGLWLVSGL